MKRVIGITGGIGSGKSAVTGELLSRGYPVIDADVISREVSGPGSAALKELASIFGPEIVDADGAFDRGAVSKIIFASPEKMNLFNHIMKGAIGARIDEEIAEYRAAAPESAAAPVKPVFLSAALLYEAGWDAKCDEVWLVTADDEIRLRRAADRDGVPAENIRARMAFQIPEAEKRKRADVTIENNGTPVELLEKISDATTAF